MTEKKQQLNESRGTFVGTPKAKPAPLPTSLVKKQQTTTDTSTSTTSAKSSSPQSSAGGDQSGESKS